MKKRKPCILLAGLLALTLVLGGCATTPQPIPVGCEKDFFYNQGAAFLPYGPALIRAGVATAMLAKPEAKPVVGAVAFGLYEIFKADYPDLVQAGKLIERYAKEAKYAGPALAALAELLPVMQLPGGGVPKMGTCDKNILLSLMRNIASDAGMPIGQ